MDRVACIIPAAGWGSVCPVRSTPKVLAEVHGELMIDRVIKTVQEARLGGSIVVVVGKNGYGEQLVEALQSIDHRDIRIAHQPERRGAADAVATALPYLDDEQHVLVTFGDMPLWRPQTLSALAMAHLADSTTAISLMTIRLLSGHRTARYGRIIRDADGRILGALEPSEFDGVDLSQAKFVNPSLYVFNLEWLANNLPLIPAVDKGDGFPPEFHLPKLLPLAHDQNVKVTEVELDDASEALGVNTAPELEEVRNIISGRME